MYFLVSSLIVHTVVLLNLVKLIAWAVCNVTTHKYHAVYYLYVPFCIAIPVLSITLMVDVSLKKMFPALLTVSCDGLVNESCTVRISVPSILLSG